MFSPVKVVDVELSPQVSDLEGLDGYDLVQALVRLHGSPIGYVTLRPVNGRCEREEIWDAVVEQHLNALLHHLVADALAEPGSHELSVDDLGRVAHPAPSWAPPVVTVAVCTRDRPADLAACLDAIATLAYPALDVVVVDNAPRSDETRRVVAAHAGVRYACEPRPGLDWARNKATAEARGEIVAFTDDDVVVDPGWVSALAGTFAEDPDVMAVTGLVVPHELDTEAQMLFERSGGFGRGVHRRWFAARDAGAPIAWHLGGAGFFGTGANMAFRRRLFVEVGDFDPALDVGTVTEGGGDLDMFFRVLKAGYTLSYEPDAIVRHRHRREYARLRAQLRSNGIGLFAYFAREARVHRDERASFRRLGLWWLVSWHLRRLAISVTNPTFFPKDLILAELGGSLRGPGRYREARRAAEALGAAPLARRPAPAATPRVPWSVAVRTVDASRPIEALADVDRHDIVKLVVTWQGRPIGSVDLPNRRRRVSAERVRDAVAWFGMKLVEPARQLGASDRWSRMLRTLTARFLGHPSGSHRPATRSLPPSRSVTSVVVATCDRPDDLRRCLRSLVAQESSRPVEIVVVDNRPASGLTPPVVAEFPGVRLVREERAGASYARNRGFTSSTGDLIVSVDDDVTVPPGWLEALVAPFERRDVLVVTAPLLPVELETEAQIVFETYGGLGRGFDRFEVDQRWMDSFRWRSVPTWFLGGTANAAFRASVFADPAVGLLDEALGPGTPTGVGEDTYVFYKVLRAGGTIVYEPAAYAWHRHRREMRALRRQIYAYSKGHVAYHLTTLLRDGDGRALARLAVGLPLAHFWRAYQRLRGRSDYTLLLLAWEIAGNLAGPWTLWRSRRRVRRLGRSQPYLPGGTTAGETPPLVDAPPEPVAGVS